MENVNIYLYCKILLFCGGGSLYVSSGWWCFVGEGDILNWFIVRVYLVYKLF